MRSPITRKSAPEIIRLLDLCYKQGVVDAAEMEDDLSVKDWLDETVESNRYGLVCVDDPKCDWKRWRFYLLRWCRDNRMSTLGFDYIDNIRKASGIGYIIIPVSFKFYLRGVRDWLQYPNEMNMALFKSKGRLRWGAEATSMSKILKNDDYIFIIQEYVYELRNKPTVEMRKITDRTIDGFEYAMWQTTRPRRGKIR